MWLPQIFANAKCMYTNAKCKQSLVRSFARSLVRSFARSFQITHIRTSPCSLCGYPKSLQMQNTRIQMQNACIQMQSACIQMQNACIQMQNASNRSFARSLVHSFARSLVRFKKCNRRSLVRSFARSLVRSFARIKKKKKMRGLHVYVV
jgi:ribosomal protein L37E